MVPVEPGRGSRERFGPGGVSSGEPGGGSPVGAGAGWKLSRDGSGVLGRGSREGFGPGGVSSGGAGQWFPCGGRCRVEIEPGWFRCAGLWVSGGIRAGRELGRVSSGEPGGGYPSGSWRPKNQMTSPKTLQGSDSPLWGAVPRSPGKVFWLLERNGFFMTMKRHATMKRQAMRMFSLLLAVVLLLGAACAVPGFTASAAEGVTSLEFAEHGLMAWRDGVGLPIRRQGGAVRRHPGPLTARGCLYAFFTDHGIYSCMGGASSQVAPEHHLARQPGRAAPHPRAVRHHDGPLRLPVPLRATWAFTVGNGMVTDNSTYGTNMVYDSVYSRGWSECAPVRLRAAVPREWLV